MREVEKQRSDCQAVHDVLRDRGRLSIVVYVPHTRLSCEAPRLVILDSTGTVRLAGLTWFDHVQSGAKGLGLRVQVIRENARGGEGTLHGLLGMELLPCCSFHLWFRHLAALRNRAHIYRVGNACAQLGVGDTGCALAATRLQRQADLIAFKT